MARFNLKEHKKLKIASLKLLMNQLLSLRSEAILWDLRLF